MPQADPTQILAELSAVFGAEAVRGGCTLAPGTSATFNDLFEKTVQRGLKDRPNAWTANAHRYIVKQVARITDDACRVARELHGAEINSEILDQATQEVIAEQQLVCERAMGMAEKKDQPGDGYVNLGIFCRKL
jgi:hypothetical protein